MISGKTFPLALLAGASLLGALSACAATPAASTPEDQITGPYADGSYEASGTYESPNGTETVDVSITLASDVITAVEVTPHPTNPNTERFQGEFAGGIADVIVGKSIDEVSVSKVAGSSLTSGGFNSALEAIKAEAVE